MMPPMPDPDVLWPDRYHGDEVAYSADAMLAYGTACAASERKRCINICNAEDEKYWRILEERKEAVTWAGERGIGASDCARKIADVANNP